MNSVPGKAPFRSADTVCEPLCDAGKAAVPWTEDLTLDEARLALVACEEDLSWTFSANSKEFAVQIARTFDDFPELELAHDRRAIARAVAAAGGKPSLHRSLLALTIYPPDTSAMEHILSESGADVELVRSLLPKYAAALHKGDGAEAPRSSIALLLKKLARERRYPPAEALAGAAEVMTDDTSLASLALGEGLLAVAGRKPSRDVDPAQFLIHAKSARNAVTRRYLVPLPPRPAVSTSTPFELDVLERAVAKLSGLGRDLDPPRREDARRLQHSNTLHLASGEISWLAVQLEFGPTTIGPQFFEIAICFAGA